MATPSELLRNELSDGDHQQRQTAGLMAVQAAQVEGPRQRRQSCVESAEAFNSPGSLASELRKTRVHAGRIRGQIKRVEEQVNNIIVITEEDEALVAELGEREEQLQQALEEAGAYVFALELRRDELNERQSRDIARSRLSGVARSVTSERYQVNGCIEDNHRSSLGGQLSPRAVLLRTQQGSTHRSVTVQRQARELNDGFLQMTPSPLGSGPILPERSISHGVQRFDLTSGTQVRTTHTESLTAPGVSYVQTGTFPETDLIDLHPGDSASMVGRDATRQAPQQYVSVRSCPVQAPSVPRKPFCDAGTVGKLTIGALKDVFRVTAHIKRVESILAEANAGRFIDGQFLPHGHLVNACREKLLGTLSGVPECHDEADKACDIDGSTWFTVTKTLRDKFARRTVLSGELDQRLKKLKFTSPKEADSFAKDAIAIGDLYRVVFPDDRAQELHLVRRVVSCLPKDIATGVIRRCRQRTGAESDQDWETSVPFHSPTCSSRDTLVEYILAECRLSEEVGSLLSQRPSGQDTVRIIQGNDGRNHKDKMRGDRGESLSSFASKFSVVYGVTGRGCRNESNVTSLMNADGVIPRFNKQGMKYFFFGFKDKTTGMLESKHFPRISSAAGSSSSSRNLVQILLRLHRRRETN
ncbi:hypothetical protein FOL47_002326 [Perkinsus chesapeaki]|uniref:Uncharacterized protein n=1 Tax=Perkinsus chesapeaki TaxID=330153 RepID=A0A7J6KPK2_PERCH|nr:hypothetical protein FOL47_002326 [Perkinsus chesapeaki]